MNQQPDLTRRDFLTHTLGASLAAAILARPGLASACDLTTNDVLGPYWVDNAPVRTILASPDEAGQRLFISGRVLANNCSTPLGNTIVDVWQATDSGCYSVVQNCPDEDPFNLRGQMLTNANGDYAFETVLPGYYPGRCRHIHFLISPPNGSPLVTQLYFQGDPRIPTDPFASQPGAVARIIPLTEDEQGRLHGNFAIQLGAGAPADAGDEEARPTVTTLHPSQPNPFRDRTVIRYQTRSAGRVAVSLHSGPGSRIRTIEDSWREPGYYTLVWDGTDDAGRPVARGLYLCRMESGSLVRYQKMLRL